MRRRSQYRRASRNSSLKVPDESFNCELFIRVYSHIVIRFSALLKLSRGEPVEPRLNVVAVRDRLEPGRRQVAVKHANDGDIAQRWQESG